MSRPVERGAIIMIMPRLTGPLALTVLGLSFPSASAADDERWIEVRSPHFAVVSNADVDKARRTAGDFERIRAVFLDALEDTRDESEPVVVLAVKDQDSLKELLPDYWERDGPRPDGVFQPGFDKHFVVLRLDGRTRARYRLIYHEYFHLLNARRLDETPPWLNEGLAEFWARTSIRGNTVEMGLPVGSRVFRRRSMLPLEELFAMEGNPHDTYPDKVSVFYAQSWALIHYIMLGDETGRTKSALETYLGLVRDDVDSVEAARRAFGDLKALEETLRVYARSDRLRRAQPMQLTSPIDVDEASFPSKSLSQADSLAVRASFLAAGDHVKSARPLLRKALELDPENVLAHETMGFLHFYQQEPEEALQWFAKAVELGSLSYISHYYYAVLATQDIADTDAWNEAERSLKRAVQINPTFSPGYGQLAYEYLRRDQNLEEALGIARRALALEPENVTYWFNTGHILLRLRRHDEALAVGERLATIATTAEERALAAAYRDNIVARSRPSSPRLESTVHYDGKGADIQPWIQTLTTAAKRHWSVSPEEAFAAGHVAVQISVHRSGQIVDLRINTSSGISALDEAAERALRRTERSPLPPLPEDYPDDVFELIMVFWYNEKPYDRT